MVCIDSAAGGWDGNGAEAGFMQRWRCANALEEMARECRLQD
jgi:hypothetical protein